MGIVKVKTSAGKWKDLADLLRSLTGPIQVEHGCLGSGLYYEVQDSEAPAPDGRPLSAAGDGKPRPSGSRLVVGFRTIIGGQCRKMTASNPKGGCRKRGRRVQGSKSPRVGRISTFSELLQILGPFDSSTLRLFDLFRHPQRRTDEGEYRILSSGTHGAALHGGDGPGHIDG